MRDHEILHVEPSASLAEIRQSYRDLVRVWHPDRFAGDPRLQKVADEKLREINQAYFALETALQQEPSPDVYSPQKTPQPGAEPSSSLAQALYRQFNRQHSFHFLWIPFTLILVTLGAARVYTFVEAPARELAWISADARRIAARNGPSLVDAFEGWNGVLPKA